MSLFNKTTEIDGVVKYGLVSSFVFVLIVNYLASSTQLLGGQTIGQISDKYSNIFTPPSVAFSIWGLIYILLAGFIFYSYGFFRGERTRISEDRLETIGKVLIVNMAFNCAWVFAWQFNYIFLSILFMAGVLVTLVFICNLLRHYHFRIIDYVFVKLPFSVYFGWITIATIVNLVTWLVSINWNGWGITPSVWTVNILIIGAAIGLFVALRNDDPAYLSVFVWAYACILLKHSSKDGYNGVYPSVIVTLSIVMSVFISIVIQLIPGVVVLMENKKTRHKKHKNAKRMKKAFKKARKSK